MDFFACSDVSIDFRERRERIYLVNKCLKSEYTFTWVLNFFCDFNGIRGDQL